MTDHASKRYATSEAKRAYRREWYQRNREKVLAQQREKRQADPDRTREDARIYRERNRERINAAARARYRRDPQARRAMLDSNRAWAQANQERVRGRNLQRKLAGIKYGKDRRRDEVSAALWHEQGGCCYLCGDPVALEDAHLEHDHRCCPKGSFCQYCIRGLSCPGCNYAVGHAYDNPDRLELIARNLRAKLAEVDQRIAAKPEQLVICPVETVQG